MQLKSKVFLGGPLASDWNFALMALLAELSCPSVTLQMLSRSDCTSKRTKRSRQTSEPGAEFVDNLNRDRLDFFCFKVPSQMGNNLFDLNSWTQALRLCDASESAESLDASETIVDWLDKEAKEVRDDE